MNDVINTFIAVKQHRGFSGSRPTGARMKKILSQVLAPFSIKRFETDCLAIPYVGIANERYFSERSIASVIQYFDCRNGVVIKFVYLPDHFFYATTPLTISNDWKMILSKNGLDNKVVSYTAEATFFDDKPASSADMNHEGAAILLDNNVLDLLSKDVFKNDPIISYKFSKYLLKEALFKAISTMSLNVATEVEYICEYFQNYDAYEDEEAEEKRPYEVDSFFSNDYPYQCEHENSFGWSPLKFAIETICQNYSECEAYFTIYDGQDDYIKQCFTNKLHKGYLLFLYEILWMFPMNYQGFKKNMNSLIGVLATLKTVQQNIGSENDLPTEVVDYIKTIEKQPERAAGMQQFKDDIKKFYDCFNAYIAEHTESVAINHLQCLIWMGLNTISKIDDIEQSLEFFKAHKVDLDLAKLPAQMQELNVFLLRMNKSKQFTEISCDQKWVLFFKHTTPNKNSELLKMCQFAFSIVGEADHANSVYHELIKDDERWNEDEYLPSGSATEKMKALMMVSNNLASMSPVVLKNLICMDDNFLKFK